MPKSRATNPQLQSTSAQIRIEVRPDTPSYYVNFIGVSHSAYDFTLSAIKIPSPLTPGQAEAAKSGEIPLEPVVQLVVPPLLIDGLIKALIDQKDKYGDTLAQQVKNNEIQHKHIKSPRTVN
jgi:hypothetical protein